MLEWSTKIDQSAIVEFLFNIQRNLVLNDIVKVQIKLFPTLFEIPPIHCAFV